MVEVWVIYVRPDVFLVSDIVEKDTQIITQLFVGLEICEGIALIAAKESLHEKISRFKFVCTMQVNNSQIIISWLNR